VSDVDGILTDRYDRPPALTGIAQAELDAYERVAETAIARQELADRVHDSVPRESAHDMILVRHADVTGRLFNLRARRMEMNDRIRDLVSEEEDLARCVAVFDRRAARSTESETPELNLD
jgi:hypothetical protein